MSVVIAQVGMMIGNFVVGKMFTSKAIINGISDLFPLIMCLMIIAVVLIFPFVAKASAKAKDRPDL